MKKDELKDALLKAPPKPPEELLVPSAPQKKSIFGGLFAQDQSYASSRGEIKQYKERLKNSQGREAALQQRIEELEKAITTNSAKSSSGLQNQQALQKRIQELENQLEHYHRGENDESLKQKELELEQRFRELYEEKKVLQTKQDKVEQLSKDVERRTKELQQKQETLEQEEQECEERRKLEGEEKQSQLTKLEQQIHDLTVLKQKLETSISEDHRKFKEETKSVLARLNQLHLLEQKLAEKEAFLAKKEQVAKELLAEVERKGIQQPVYGQSFHEEPAKPAITLQQKMVQAKNPQVFDSYAAVAEIKKRIQERNLEAASRLMNELRQRIAATKDAKMKEEMESLLLELNTDLELAKL